MGPKTKKFKLFTIPELQIWALNFCEQCKSPRFNKTILKTANTKREIFSWRGLQLT